MFSSNHCHNHPPPASLPSSSSSPSSSPCWLLLWLWLSRAAWLTARQGSETWGGGLLLHPIMSSHITLHWRKVKLRHTHCVTVEKSQTSEVHLPSCPAPTLILQSFSVFKPMWITCMHPLGWQALHTKEKLEAHTAEKSPPALLSGQPLILQSFSV